MKGLYRLKLGVYTKCGGNENNPLADQYYDLEPQMLAMLLVFEDLAMEYLSDVVYTSLFRLSDTASVHGHGRGADVRIYNEARGIPARSVGAGPTPEIAVWLVNSLNAMFGPFEGNDGKDHACAIIHGEGTNRHIHLQCPARGWR